MNSGRLNQIICTYARDGGRECHAIMQACQPARPRSYVVAGSAGARVMGTSRTHMNMLQLDPGFVFFFSLRYLSPFTRLRGLMDLFGSAFF